MSSEQRRDPQQHQPQHPLLARPSIVSQPQQEHRPPLWIPIASAIHQQNIQGENIIPNVDITRLMRFVLEDRPPIEQVQQDMERSREILEAANKFARELIDVFIRDGIQRIMHPKFAESAVKARLWAVTLIMTKLVHEKWSAALRLIEAKAPAKDVARAVRDAMLASELAPLIVTRLYDMLIHIAFINAPAKLRPPLANVALGYDIMG